MRALICQEREEEGRGCATEVFPLLLGLPGSDTPLSRFNFLKGSIRDEGSGRLANGLRP